MCSRSQDCDSETNSEESLITCQCRKDYTGKSCNVHSGGELQRLTLGRPIMQVIFSYKLG